MQTHLIKIFLGGEWATTLHPRWEMDSEYGRDTLNFGALPGGERFGDFNGSFWDLGFWGMFWSSSDWNNNGDVFRFTSGQSNVGTLSRIKTQGLSIRCMRDATPEEEGLDDGSFVGKITDYDDNEYDLVKISDKVWTVQNFAGTHYSNGTPITHVPDDGDWDDLELTDEAYCDYDNDENYTFFDDYNESIW